MDARVNNDLFGDAPPPAFDQVEEDLHLAADHALIKVTAYIRDEDKARQRTKNAARVAKHREKVRDAGMVSPELAREYAKRGIDLIDTAGLRRKGKVFEPSSVSMAVSLSGSSSSV